MSSVVLRPVIRVSSTPASPSLVSLPSPLFQIIASLPLPPSIVSLPVKPVMRSLPSPPMMCRVGPPTTMSSPAPGSIVSVPVAAGRFGAGHGRVEVGGVGEAGGGAEVVLQQPGVGADDDGVRRAVAGQRRGVAGHGAGHGRAGRARHGEGRGGGAAASTAVRRELVFTVFIVPPTTGLGCLGGRLVGPPFPGVSSRTEHAGGVSRPARHAEVLPLCKSAR